LRLRPSPTIARHVFLSRGFDRVLSRSRQGLARRDYSLTRVLRPRGLRSGRGREEKPYRDGGSGLPFLEEKHLPRFQRTIRKIIAYDLDLIEHHCDGVVCYWDQNAGRGAGTQGELTFAYRLGIPVYLICGIPIEEMSGWLLGCAREVFAGFDDFRDFVNTRLPRAAAETSGSGARGNIR